MNLSMEEYKDPWDRSNRSVALEVGGSNISIDDGYHTDDSQAAGSQRKFYQNKTVAEAVNLQAKPMQDSLCELFGCLINSLTQFCECLSVLPAQCLNDCTLAALCIAILLGISYLIGILWVTARLGMYDIRFVNDDDEYHSTLFAYCKHGSDNMMYQKNVCDYYDFKCLTRSIEDEYTISAPSFSPTLLPSVAPLRNDSNHSTTIPTNYPTTFPTTIPLMMPSVYPTEVMTNAPTLSPTAPAHLDREEFVQEFFVKLQLFASFVMWGQLRLLMSVKRDQDKKEAKNSGRPCWYPSYSLCYLLLFLLKNMVSYNFRSLGFLTVNLNNCQVVRSAYYPEWYGWLIPTFIASFFAWAISVCGCLTRADEEDVLSDEVQQGPVVEKKNDQETRLVLRTPLNMIFNCKSEQRIDLCSWLINWILALGYFYCVFGPSVCLIGINMYHDLRHALGLHSRIRNNSNGLSPFNNHGILQVMNAFVVEIQSYFVPAFIFGPFTISTILSNVLTIMDLFITFLKLIVDMQDRCCRKDDNNATLPALTLTHTQSSTVTQNKLHSMDR